MQRKRPKEKHRRSEPHPRNGERTARARAARQGSPQDIPPSPRRGRPSTGLDSGGGLRSHDDNDDFVHLTRVPELLPNKTSYGTIYRWAIKGIAGVRLHTNLIGGRWYTTRRWLNEFFERRTLSHFAKRNMPIEAEPLHIDDLTADRRLKAAGL